MSIFSLKKLIITSIFYYYIVTHRNTSGLVLGVTPLAFRWSSK